MTGRDKHLIEGSKEDRARLFSVVPSDRTRCKGRKLKDVKFHLSGTKIFFCCEDGQTLEQAAQRACEVSVLGNIQDPTGHSLEQLL